MLDPTGSLDGAADVLVEDGRVVAVGPGLAAGAANPETRTIDVAGRLVTPGLVDLHVHLREPGQEEKETIASGAAAAAAGGFTTVCAMPNTDPVIDRPERVAELLERARAARGARVLPIAAASVGSAGTEPTDARALAAAGAVALSDDGLPIASAELLERILAGAGEAGLPVADHCERRELSLGGAVFAGPVARRLGVAGIPPEAESDAVARDLDVLARAGGRLHLCHLSTARSVDLLREAKAAGLPVTAEVTPHHLLLTSRSVAELGAAAKMNPPLARESDREAVVAALVDGTIDCVATDHAPHTRAEKAVGLARAPFGVVGLETAFGLLYTGLVLAGRLPLAELVRRLTVQPAEAFGLPAGRLSPGSPADLAVFDLVTEWTVDPTGFRSRSRNTPFAGRRLTGRPWLTMVGGEIVFEAAA